MIKTRYVITAITINRMIASFQQNSCLAKLDGRHRLLLSPPLA